MANLPDWLMPILSLLGSTATSGIIIAWWRHQERKRSQSDNVALSLVDQLSHRITVLEAWVKDLQARLGEAEAGEQGLFWLLKYCPDDRRDEAVADAERRLRERDQRRSAHDLDPSLLGELRNAAQMIKSAGAVVAGKMAAG